MYQRRKSKYNFGPYRSGTEKAIEHIRQAEEFSKKTGHTDFIVKQYLYSLSSSKLKIILNKYEEIYGEKRRNYLEETIPLWKNKKRKMSGEVAKRLYNLIPPLMPLSDKLKIVDKLWRHCSPSSRKQFTITKDTNANELHNQVISYLNDTVQKYLISEEISNDFNWLAENDSLVYQELKNAFLQKEKELISQCTLHRIQAILQYLNNSQDYYSSISQTLNIGRHEIIIKTETLKPQVSHEPIGSFFDNNLQTQKNVQSSKNPISSFFDDYGCFIYILIFIIFCIFADNIK